MKKIIPILICCCSVVSGSLIEAKAQNNTSPYSLIGIGDIEKSSFDRTSGMGHAGVALSSNRYVYQVNPASYAALDQHFFHFEAAARFKYVSYTGSPVSDFSNNKSSDLQFKKVTLGTKITPRWAIGLGLTPFSTVNYSFAGEKPIQGSNLFADAYYSGTGSTNQAFITNSFVVNKNLNIGLQTSYLFGQIEEKETLTGQLTDSGVITTRNVSIGQARFKLGAQYQAKLNKLWNIAAGGTISNKTDLRANYSLRAVSGNTLLLENDYYKTSYFTLPLSYQVGGAATFRNMFTLAFDYQYEGWRETNYSGVSYILDNSQRFSGGFEFSKKVSYMNQSYEKFFLQTGLFYSDSYLRINGIQLKDYGLTFGAGAELSRTQLSSLAIQGAIELGVRGTTDKGLIRERYTQFTLSLCYRDFWFSRKMKRYE
ncbi:MAG: hypothetical protein NTZ47_04035 [Bacteroidetes bacterium]|nr:hypothetical protein [Bacteroidota bacterium]